MRKSFIDPRDYYSRLQGLVSPALHTKRVLAAGCGAGSYMLEKLARVGLGEVRLADFDRVHPANLCRTTYDVDDIGDLKVAALARHIESANPFVRVESFPVDICSLTADVQRDLLEDVDLVIAGTDHFPAQALINKWSQQWSIPAVFVGIHEKAQGGRIIWTLPGQTPCYRCLAWQRYEHFASGGPAATDLSMMHGVLVDIQFIDMVALKVCLAILERGQDSAMGLFFERMNYRNEIIVRTSPEYAYGAVLWQAILGDLPKEPKPYAREIEEQALFAMDTVWLKTEYFPECPDCRGSKASQKGEAS